MTVTTPLTHTETSVTLTRYRDAIIEAHGEPVDSLFAETFWLPVVGPTSLWLLRYSERMTTSGAYVVEQETLARCLGIGTWQTLSQSFTRLSHFGLARQLGEEEWALRTHVPPLTARQRQRLPDRLRERYEALIAAGVHDRQEVAR